MARLCSLAAQSTAASTSFGYIAWTRRAWNYDLTVPGVSDVRHWRPRHPRYDEGRHRRNVSLFARGNFFKQRHRPLDRRKCFSLARAGIEVRVVIHAEREGDAPVSHRAFGVQLGRLAEGSLGLVEVEASAQRQPLIKEALRQTGAGRHRKVDVASPSSSSAAMDFRSRAAQQRQSRGPPWPRSWSPA